MSSRGLAQTCLCIRHHDQCEQSRQSAPSIRTSEPVSWQELGNATVTYRQRRQPAHAIHAAASTPCIPRSRVQPVVRSSTLEGSLRIGLRLRSTIDSQVWRAHHRHSQYPDPIIDVEARARAGIGSRDLLVGPFSLRAGFAGTCYRELSDASGLRQEEAERPYSRRIADT
jgi:hypothetical protein